MAAPTTGPGRSDTDERQRRRENSNATSPQPATKGKGKSSSNTRGAGNEDPAANQYDLVSASVDSASASAASAKATTAKPTNTKRLFLSQDDQRWQQPIPSPVSPRLPIESDVAPPPPQQQPEQQQINFKRTSFFRSSKAPSSSSSSRHTNSAGSVEQPRSHPATHTSSTGSAGTAASFDASAGRIIADDVSLDRSVDQGSPRLARLGSTIQPGYDQSQHLDEPDDYDPEGEYQRALQRQFQHRLRVLDRGAQSSSGSTSLLSKFKNPLSRSSDTQQIPLASSAHPQSQSYDESSSASASQRPVSASFPSTNLNLARVVSSTAQTRSTDSNTLKIVMSANEPSGASGSRATPPAQEKKSPASKAGNRTPSSRLAPGLPEEVRDVSQSIFIWRRETKATSSSKTFLPQVSGVTRKMTKRDRDQSAQSGSPSSNETSRLNQLTHNWLRERPSKSRLGTASGDGQGGSASTSGTGVTSSSSSPVLAGVRKDGSWKKGRITFRDDGSLYIFGQEQTLVHAVQADRVKLNQVRPIDDSLFGRANVVGIFSRPPVFAGRRHPTSGSTTSTSTPSSKDPTAAADDPIYIAFPSSQKQRLWIALLHAWGEPEIFCHPHDVKRGGAHRWYRHIDTTLLEYKPIGAASQSQASAWSAVAAASSMPFNAYDRGKSASVDLPMDARREAWATSQSPIAPNEGFGAPGDGAHSGGPLGSSRPSLSSLRHSSHGRRDSLASQSSFATTASGGQLGESQIDHTADISATTADDSVSVFDTSARSALALSRIGSDAHAHPHSPSIMGSNHSTPDLSPFTRGAAKFKGGNSSKSGDRDQLHVQGGSGPSSGTNFIPTAVYCLIYVNGILAGRSGIRGADSRGAAFWPEKFAFKNLDTLRSLRVDVYQPGSGQSNAANQSGTSGATSTATKGGKSTFIGSAEIPLVNFRRGEEIESCFPVWSTRAPTASPANGHPLTVHAMESLGAECVGQVKLSLKMREEAVRLREKYEEVEGLLNSSDCIPLIRELARHFEEKPTIGHLIDIYTSCGQIPDRLGDLVLAESEDFDQTHPELLFRGNSLLTRSVDQFQRLYCRDWLDASIGEQVRFVCENRISIGMEDLASYAQSSKRDHGTSDGLGQSASAGRSTPSIAIEEGSAVDTLRTITSDLWKSIYANRHNCPVDLRKVLSEIRRRVNTKFGTQAGAPTGMQGVGAFVFLRLICPAITAPHLYGLMAFAPDSETSGKVLMLVAKVLLGLANKRGAAFDPDKEPGLALMNDFLQQTAPAYDDYITLVSTSEVDPYASPKMGSKKDASVLRSGPSSPAVRQRQRRPLTPLRGASTDEDDRAVQQIINQKLSQLPPIHLEAVASPPYLLDQSLALASFVSFISRNADLSLLDDGADGSEGQQDSPACVDSQDRKLTTAHDRKTAGPSLLQQFLEVCLEHEQRLGYYIDRAGFEPVSLSLLQQEADRTGKTSVPYTFVSTWKSDSARKANDESANKSSTPNRSEGQTAQKSGRIGSPPTSPGMAGSPFSKSTADRAGRSVGSLRGRRATLSSSSGGDESRETQQGRFAKQGASAAKSGTIAGAGATATSRHGNLDLDTSNLSASTQLSEAELTPSPMSPQSTAQSEAAGDGSKMPVSSSSNSVATLMPVAKRSLRASRTPSVSSSRRPVSPLSQTVPESERSPRPRNTTTMEPSSSRAHNATPETSPRTTKTRARAATAIGAAAGSSSSSTPPKRFSTELGGWAGGATTLMASGSSVNVMGGLPWQGSSRGRSGSTSTSVGTGTTGQRTSVDAGGGEGRPFGLANIMREAATTASKSRKWWQRRQ